MNPLRTRSSTLSIVFWRAHAREHTDNQWRGHAVLNNNKTGCKAKGLGHAVLYRQERILARPKAGLEHANCFPNTEYLRAGPIRQGMIEIYMLESGLALEFSSGDH